MLHQMHIWCNASTPTCGVFLSIVKHVLKSIPQKRRRWNLKVWLSKRNLLFQKSISRLILIYLEPVCPLFWGVEPSKTRPFSIKTRAIWVPGIYIYNYIYIYSFFLSFSVGYHNPVNLGDCSENFLQEAQVAIDVSPCLYQCMTDPWSRGLVR